MFLDELARILRLKVTDGEKIKLARAETQKIQIAEEAMELERIKLLHQRFEGVVVPRKENLTFFTVEETIDLGIARDNVEIYNRPFKTLTITEHLPGAYETHPHTWGAMRPKAYLRFNSASSPLYRVRYGEVRGNFNKLYLTNIAQSGYYFSYVIGNNPNASYGMRGDTTALLEGLNLLKGGVVAHKSLEDIYNMVDEGVKPSISLSINYNITMANADTEYSQVLPIYTKNVKAVLADLSAFRLAWVEGKVAGPTVPYWTQPANIPFEMSGQNFNADRTLYFASPAASKVMQIHIDR